MDRMDDIVRLQEDLRTLWLVTCDDGLEVGVSGVLGEGTSLALRHYQQTRGLPVTGEGDRATVSAIRKEAGRMRFYREPPRSISPFLRARDGVVRVGEVSALAAVIRMMLDDLSAVYDFDPVPPGMTYDTTAADAVRRFQEIGGIPSPAGVVDRLTWNRLAEEWCVECGEAPAGGLAACIG